MTSILVVTCVALSPPVFAEETEEQEEREVAIRKIVIEGKDLKGVKKVEVEVKTHREQDTDNPWKFGLAVGFERYRTDTIEDALVGKDRILSVTNSTGWHNNLWAVGSRGISRRLGVFAALKVETEDGKAGLKDAALGISFDPDKSGFVFGVGVANHKVKRFAAGLKEGDKLPEHFRDDIPYREQSEWGLVFLVAYEVIPNLFPIGKKEK